MSVSAKKLLFILPSLCRAGAETQTIDLINGLDSKNYKKCLVTFEKNIDQLIRIDHKNVTYYHCERTRKLDLSLVRNIANIIDRENIELVHCSLQIALFMGWLGTKLSKRKPKLVLAVHTTINRSKRYDLADKYLYQWLMRDCEKIIFVCKSQEIHWVSKFPFLKESTKVIYNGVDTDYFNPDQYIDHGINFKSELDIPEQGKIMCLVAAFRPEKGHLILLKAFKDVLRKIPNAYLVFAGDGALLSSVKDKVSDYGIHKNVRFLGNVTDIRPVLAAANISVLASTAVETFSMAMLESMSMKVPLVATDMGGTAEAVLHNSTGIIVKPYDHAELAAALEQLLLNDERRERYGQASRDLVVKKFTKKNMVNETALLIEHVLDLKGVVC